MNFNGLIVFVNLLVQSMCSEKTETTEGDAIEQLIIDKHLREEGFTAFKTATIHEKIMHPFKDRQPVSQQYLHRRRRSIEHTNDTLELELQVFNETFDLKLKYNTKIIESITPVFIRTEDKLEVWRGQNPDCFLEGRTSRMGVVTLSYCNGITGSVIEGSTMYRIDPIGEVSEEFREIVLVSKGHVPVEESGIIDHPKILARSALNHTKKHRQKRQIPSTSFTIEVGIFVDEFFYNLLETDNKALTTEQKINMVVLKWNGVQAMMDLMVIDLQYTVTLQIKSIEFWQTDPGWFVLDVNDMSPTLDSFCSGTLNRVDVLPVDLFFLHTGSIENRGLAYFPGQCTGSNCGLETGRSFYLPYLPSHEIGHTLNMGHDDTHDPVCSRPDSGIMQSAGLYTDMWSTCNKQDLDAFLATPDAACLFQEDVAPELVDAAISSIVLPPGEWPGMTQTVDDYCEQTSGPGWKYRDWYADWGPCTWHSCINLNPGPTYGNMVTGIRLLPGTHCADSSICGLSNNCVTYADARFDVTKLIVVQGGWSAWGAMSGCSRTCGTGMMVKKRTCTNPKPRSAPPCTGSAFHAEICNTIPCLDDPSGSVINHRAGEVCAAFVANGVLSSTEYDGTGTKYYSSGDAQCEVKCNTQPGITISGANKVRYGLMPNGVSCTLATATYNDQKGYPRGHGSYGRCVEGYCETFSPCTNTASSIIQDLCGVCGGDNSTCIPVDGVYLDTLPQSEHVEFVTLPAGTKNILFYCRWGDMRDNYVEIFDTSGTILFSTPFTFDSDTSTNPKQIAGANWYYLWYRQFLYTFDELTSDIVIKFYNQNGNPNVGITYGYSLPLGATVSSTSSTVPTSSMTSSNTASSTVSTSSVTSSNTASVTVSTSPVTSSNTASVTVSTSSVTSSSTILSTVPVTTSSSTNQNTLQCDRGYIRCDNGNCIRYRDICNDVDDCGDNSDEPSLCGAGSLHVPSVLAILIVIIPLIL